MTNQTPMKSSGGSQRTGEDNMSMQELRKELNSLRYQSSLREEVAFRDLLLRQLAIMNQNILNIKEAIEKASLDEGEDSYEETKREPVSNVRQDYPDDEVDEEGEEDSEQEFDDDKPRPRGRPKLQ